MGLVSMMIGVQMLMPFGKNVVPRPGGSPGFIGLLLACFWILTAGPALCILHLVAGLAMCLTVIGIPIGLQNFKFMQVALLPMHYDDLRRHQMTTPAHLRNDGYQAQRDLILASHLDRLQ